MNKLSCHNISEIIFIVLVELEVIIPKNRFATLLQNSNRDYKKNIVSSSFTMISNSLL